MVRAETLSADGLPIAILTASSDQSGAVSFTVPTSQRAMMVRLTAISPGTDATTTVTLSPGQTRSLTLTVPDSGAGATQLTSGATIGDGIGGTAIAAGGPETIGPSPTNMTGWFALAGLLLAALVVGFPALRRVHRR